MRILDSILAQPTPSPTPRPDSRGRSLILVCAYAFFLLSLLSTTLALGLNPDDAQAMAGGGSLLRQVSAPLVAALLFLALRPWADYRRLLTIPTSLLIVLLYCWASATWAIEPSISLRRTALLTLGVWMLFTVMRRFRFEEILHMLRWILVLVLIANYAAVIVAPNFGTHTGAGIDNSALAGDWRGILEQKNIAGAACAFTILLFAFDRGGMKRKLQFAVLLAAGYFLYRSNSKTSIALCLASLTIGMVFLRYRLKHKWLVMGILGFATLLAAVLNAVYKNPLVAKLDDPQAFTGRTQIWNMLLHYIRDHPLLGSGYGSFWNIGPGSPVYTYADASLSQTPYGHNGFLDMAAQIGLPGLVLVVVVTIFLPFRKMLGSPLFSGQKGALLAALFTFCVSYNFTETALYYTDSFVWTMLLTTIALSRPDIILYTPERFAVQKLVRLTPGAATTSRRRKIFSLSSR